MNYFPEYVQLALSEIPSEISAVVPLAGCSHSCYHCHSPQYQDRNGGEWLTYYTYRDILEKYYRKASCILFFGGEYDTEELVKLSWLARLKGFKTALYSGFEYDELPENILREFTYIKTGKYVEELGGINIKGTNQRLWKRVDGELVDITAEMQRG